MQTIGLLVQVFLYSLVNPMVIVPAIIVAFFARSTVQLLLGAAIIGVALIALSLLRGVPAGVEIILWLVPFTFVAPLIWVFAIARLLKWLRRDSATQPGSTMRRVVGGVLGAVIGSIAGGVIGSRIGSIAADIFKVSSFEGGAGFFVAFLFSLPGMIIGAIVGAIVGARQWRRAQPTAPTTTTAPPPAVPKRP
jgi:hypothetical protein